MTIGHRKRLQVGATRYQLRHIWEVVRSVQVVFVDYKVLKYWITMHVYDKIAETYVRYIGLRQIQQLKFAP